MTEQQKTDAVNYLKEVMHETSDGITREIGEIILHAYLRGREDEERLLLAGIG